MSLAASPGCVYRLGAHLSEGLVDGALKDGGSVDQMRAKLLEEQYARQIGAQLGQGLASGATDLSPEQQQKLQDAIDGLLAVAAARTGQGLHDEVSPAIRQMVREDIVHTLSEGMKGELAPTMEQTVDAVVTRAIVSLRRGLQDPDTKLALGELIRDSLAESMREGPGATPGVGDQVQYALTDNVLEPIQGSVKDISDIVADKVEDQATKTQRTLQGVIFALAVVLGVFMIMYIVSRRQLLRERTVAQEHEQGIRQINMALGLLDEDTRSRVMGKIDEYHQTTRKVGKGLKVVEPSRSDDYLRSAAGTPRPAPRRDDRNDDYTRKK